MVRGACGDLDRDRGEEDWVRPGAELLARALWRVARGVVPRAASTWARRPSDSVSAAAPRSSRSPERKGGRGEFDEPDQCMSQG
eukprot:2848744-Prymnesium_polylepis.1